MNRRQLHPFRRLFFGSTLKNSAEHFQRLSKAKSLALSSSDALSTVAYATEEILLVLIIAGPLALSLSTPIAITITVLLAIVAASYYQTIHGDPNGGGPTLSRMKIWGRQPD